MCLHSSPHDGVQPAVPQSNATWHLPYIPSPPCLACCTHLTPRKHSRPLHCVPEAPRPFSPHLEVMALVKPHGLNGLTVEEATKNVHLALRELLTDEYPDLARRRISRKQRHYLQSSFNIVKNYLINSFRTWWDVIKLFGKMFIGGVCECAITPQLPQTTNVILAPVDFLAGVAFSLAITVILAGGLVICIICNIPFLDKAYAWYAKRHGGVTFINIGETYIASIRLSLSDMDSSE